MAVRGNMLHRHIVAQQIRCGPCHGDQTLKKSEVLSCRVLPSELVDSHRLELPNAENSVMRNTIWPASGEDTPCSTCLTRIEACVLHSSSCGLLMVMRLVCGSEPRLATFRDLTLYRPVGPSHLMVFLAQSMKPPAALAA